MDKHSENKSGYGKPPKSGQFRKGKSGNPKGRPKKDRDMPFITIFAKELNEVISVTGNDGVKQKLSKKEIITKRLISDAMNGKPSAMKTLIEIGKHGQAIYWL